MAQTNPAQPAVEELSFEAALQELEQVVEQMESDELPLDQMLALFERGTQLAAQCSRLLDQAELRVAQLGQGGEETEA